MTNSAQRPPPATVLAAVLMVVTACGSTEPEPEDPATNRVVADRPSRGAAGEPFNLAEPTIGKLDPDLLAAVQAAARDARDDGVAMRITSGWRSREHQQRLYDEAVARYGSEEEARRYVATPDTSAHVTGDAVDIGPTDADVWLIEHGADYGLCQTFANEIWHFELATEPGGTCPAMLPDGSSRN